MKTRFDSYDIVCAVTELQKIVGLRVNQIYDVDKKTYLIKLQGSSDKVMLLIESGSRFHTTEFEIQKSVSPSGFSMKMRKHLKNKRLEEVRQLEADRIVDFKFGSKEAAYHIFLELYDRGNIVLTDYEYTILYTVRPHTEKDGVRIGNREKYPLMRAKKPNAEPTLESLQDFVKTVQPGEYLRRALMTILDCGPAVIEHVLTKNDLYNCTIGIEQSEDAENKKFANQNKQKKRIKSLNDRVFDMEKDMAQLVLSIKEANDLLQNARSSVSEGFIIQQKTDVPTIEGENEKVFYQNIEYHPYNFCQFKNFSVIKKETFLMAVDEFHSNLESQKINLKTVNQEREAVKKLTNVKKDHMMRLEELNRKQEIEKKKAEIITFNQELVDNAILAVRSAIAIQMPWPDINELVKAAQAKDDPVAKVINQLKLEVNQISLKLPNNIQSNEKEDCCEETNNNTDHVLIDVDLNMSAWKNARKYYDLKRMAAKKEEKTINASMKALKSAEWKTHQTLRDVRTISNICKRRKTYWFEKFYWFISSENYLVIAGRDAQQNELIVKRYMRPSDIYVHAEIQGASSVVIRNPLESEVPPKTLLEAGTMAVSYSVAWNAKVITNVYWVKSDQVSKVAPTGEYLGTGSFMIRGKKNFLPPCNLVMGVSLLFKIEDSSIEKHRGERRPRTFDDDNQEGYIEALGTRREHYKEKKHEKDQPDLYKGQDDKSITENVKEDHINEREVKRLSQFPDTQVQIEHSMEQSLSNLDIKATDLSAENDVPSFVTPAPARIKQKHNTKKNLEKVKKKEAEKKQQCYNQEIKGDDANKAKRGQRGKLKKLKSKYRDQDEEERLVRMNLLKSEGQINTSPSENLQDEAHSFSDEKLPQKVFERQPDNNHNDQENEDDTEDVVHGDADVDMLDSLTGQPCDDDELLFVIPVVAPYQAIQSYKYKLKLIPGSGKRGKAAKTSLLMFSKDKLCNNREKDLLKSINDDMLARNIPGKVKLNTPQLQKSKN